MIKVDKDQLAEAIDNSPFGTGTLSEEAGIEGDELLGLLALGEAEDSVVKKVEKVLPGDWIKADETPKEAEKETTDKPSTIPTKDKSFGDLTIDSIKKLVKGEKVNASEALRLESSRPKEDQRTTLIDWLKDS